LLRADGQWPKKAGCRRAAKQGDELTPVGHSITWLNAWPQVFDDGGKSNFNALTATTISTRLLTSSARIMALTWVLTVASDKSRSRQIALLGFPCITSASTSH